MGTNWSPIKSAQVAGKGWTESSLTETAIGLSETIAVPVGCSGPEDPVTLPEYVCPLFKTIE